MGRNYTICLEHATDLRKYIGGMGRVVLDVYIQIAIVEIVSMSKSRLYLIELECSGEGCSRK